MMLLSQTFVKLLHVWDSDLLGEVPHDLIREQIPIILLQILLSFLREQLQDGSWKFKTAAMETTAYAVLSLKALVSVPWHSHLQTQVSEAITRGLGYLASKYGSWNQHEHIWVAKVTYALPPISRAYVVAALVTDTTHVWHSKVRSLIAVPNEKLHQMANFFASLPIFRRDRLWAIEADILLGFLHAPQLFRTASGLFPRRERGDRKYMDYIPFTWIATNRLNGSPLSNSILWEMMTMSVLIYHLDEFMETISSRLTESATLDDLRHLIQQLCAFREPEADANPDICGLVRDNIPANITSGVNMDSNHSNLQKFTLAEAQAILECLTTHILQHHAVVKSPDRVRKQLHSELCSGILAHLDHEEDNIRYATQRRAQIQRSRNSVWPTEHLPYSPACGSYYSWIRTTSADNTQAPSTFTFFSCLAAPAGKPFFRGIRQHYGSCALSRHLANLCRQYNDYGSVERDRAEGTLNSIDFVEFHETNEDAVGSIGGSRVRPRDISAMKADLFHVAEFERECLNHAMDMLGAELRGEHDGQRKIKTLKVFVDTTDLYGQIYIARDISDRVK